jgi:membrane protein YqaA with SNARE-associated domain
MVDLGGILDQLMDYLDANQTDPVTYLLILFIFSVAAAVFLPLPVEIGLIWNPGVFFPVKALVLGLGKGVGAVAVFYIGAVLNKIASRTHRLGPVSRMRRVIAETAHRLGLDRWRVYTWLTSKRPRRSEPEIPRWGWLRWIATKSEVFVRRFGVLAMYLIMSIPGMVDTVPLYVFALLNKEGTLMTLRAFAIANFLAGINRAFLIYAILELLGVRLFV